MRTTLDLPDALFKEVKMRAVQQGVTLKELLATYIQAGMRVPKIQEEDKCISNARSMPPVGWKRVPGEPLTPARSNAELYAILEQEDIENLERVYGQTESKS